MQGSEHGAAPPAGVRELVAVVGRFQPFHVGHLDLVMRAHEMADRVVVGITNPDVRSRLPVAASQHRHRSDANPYSYLDRARMVAATLRAAGTDPGAFDVVPFPLHSADVCASYVPAGTLQVVRAYSDWEHEKAGLLEQLGYPVLVLPGELASRVSGTDIRAAMHVDQSWRALVPAGALGVLDRMPGFAAGRLPQALAAR